MSGLLRRWRGREMSTGTNGGPYMYAGDNGWGDTDGPQLVQNNNHLQSRIWIAKNLLEPSTTTRRWIGLQHFFGNATNCYVGWTFPGGERSEFSFRIGIRNGTYWQTNGDRTFICATRANNTVKSWEIRQTQDTLQIINGPAGFQSSYNGRRPYLRSSGTSDVFATPPSGTGIWQMGGNGYNGANTQFTGWIEGRQTTAGVLTIRYLNMAGVEQGRHEMTLPTANRSVDTLCFGTYDVTTAHVGAEGLYHFDLDVWDDAPSTGWPRGAYVPGPAKFERVSATGPLVSDVVTEPMEVVGKVAGSPGQVLGQPGTSVVSLGAWTFRSEKVLPPMRRNYDVAYKTATAGEGDRMLNIFRPLESDFAGPYRTVVWWHSGFFYQGSRYALPEAWAAKLCARGYAVVAPAYPLVDPPTLTTVSYVGQTKHPRQIQWAKRAMWWLQQTANAATWNLDPTKMVSCGYSAGGNLALQVNLTRNLASDRLGQDTRVGTLFSSDDPSIGQADPPVVGTFVYAAPTDWQAAVAGDTTGFIVPFTARAYMGLGISADYSSVYETSPVHYVTTGDAPIGYVSGSADVLINATQRTNLQAKCLEFGVPFQGWTITADHDNIDTANDPDNTTNGIVPWLNNLFGSAP